MSRALMGTADIPKYIAEICKGKLHLARDGAYNPGYTFRLYGNWPIGYEDQLKANAEKLVSWAKRFYAEAEIVAERFWYDRYRRERQGIFDPSASKRAARNAGFRNYIILEITDPVARILEKAGLVNQ